MTEIVKPKVINPNYNVGMWTSLIGGIYLAIMYPVSLIAVYWDLIYIERAKGPAGCEANVKYYYPAYTDMGIIGGVLLITAAYGFYKRKDWAVLLSVSGAVMGLKWSFWPMVPPMSNGIFPQYLYVFVPAFIIYLSLTKLALNLSYTRIGVGVLGGMAAITSFMNSIAATNRILAVGEPGNTIYIMADRLNMVAGVTLMIITIALLITPEKEWVKVTGIIAILVEQVVGIPVATMYTIEVGRISFFFMGPIFSLLLLLCMISPKIWNKVIQD